MNLFSELTLDRRTSRMINNDIESTKEISFLPRKQSEEMQTFVKKIAILFFP